MELVVVQRILMKAAKGAICFVAVIERLAPEVPRFVVYPGKAWDETGTFIVQVSLNGIPLGLRNLIPWKERGWHFGLLQPMCRKVGVETGDECLPRCEGLGRPWSQIIGSSEVIP